MSGERVEPFCLPVRRVAEAARGLMSVHRSAGSYGFKRVARKAETQPEPDLMQASQSCRPSAQIDDEG